jgi:replicative DNA helicase
MNREEARQYITTRATEYLSRDNSRKGYLCPICKSGSGRDGTGLTTKDGVHFTCWGGGCFTNSDIIDIIGLEYQLTGYNEKLQKAAELFHITIDGKGDGSMYQKQDKSKQDTQQHTHNNAYTTQQKGTDYTEFFLQANKDIDKTDYHRGLTLDTLNRFKLGYVAEWRHPKAPNAPASPRLIIPVTRYSYLARDTRAELTKEQEGYKKAKVKGKEHVTWTFNYKALKTARQPIFIVEGELDALSIIDVGGEAIGLGSLSYIKSFLFLLEKQRPQQPLIISLDNEQEPEKKAKVEKQVGELIAGIERLGIPCYRQDISAPHKDANEALMADREAFARVVHSAIEKVQEEAAEALEAEKEALRRESVGSILPNFINSIEESSKAVCYPTGFFALDNLIDGGLYAGLYIIGAISSLGKTTFALQIGDNIAAAGHDVLVFSLEMARNELIAKSVSRNTLIKDFEQYGSTTHAKTTRGILTGTRYAGYSQQDKALIRDAIAAYGEYAQNIYIMEGIGNIGIEEIRAKVQNHIRVMGKPPVVIIDYLQILAPADARATDKQNTDKAVLELKRMSRDYGIPVIGISSFNRDNYTAPVNMTSFKESGAIEYSSDTLIGLQYYGMDYQEGEADKARDKRIRELTKANIATGKEGKPQKIQVKVLKNRNGSKGDTVLDFYPMFNYFTDTLQEETAEEGGNWKQAQGSFAEPY